LSVVHAGWHDMRDWQTQVEIAMQTATPLTLLHPGCTLGDCNILCNLVRDWFGVIWGQNCFWAGGEDLFGVIFILPLALQQIADPSMSVRSVGVLVISAFSLLPMTLPM
jgi:hypothetical protein